MLEILSSLVCTFWDKSKLHINTYFLVTGWMLCAIPHIHKDAKYNSDRDHRKQFNYVIKMLFNGLSIDEMCFNLDLFWNEYTAFDNNNSPFDSEDFSGKSNTSDMVIVIFGIQNIHFLVPRFLLL